MVQVWLVTGCSSGLGRQLVTAILGRGDKVIATSRRISDLDYITSIDADPTNALRITLDVTETHEILQKKINQAFHHFGTIDVLVNNAGFVVSGVWEEISYDEMSQQLETNFFGALKVTRAILPFFRQRRSGVILFMGSIAGWHGVGAGGPYSASKFALEGAAECLAKETSHLGIRTHILVLGQFRTGILNEDKKGGTLQCTEISDYDAIKAEMSKRHKETNGKQPGNPVSAAQKILDIVNLENLPLDQTNNMPLRIPLGSDAVGVMRSKCEQTLASLAKWDVFASGTDFPDGNAVPDYCR